MTREEIEQAIEESGWQLDSGFAEDLLVGNDTTVSILAPRWVWGLGDAVFELWDEESNLSYWVREIPTPPRAKELLKEHGAPPEEEHGNPYKQDQ